VYQDRCFVEHPIVILRKSKDFHFQSVSIVFVFDVNNKTKEINKLQDVFVCKDPVLKQGAKKKKACLVLFIFMYQSI
jgi:hypothetical protein